MGLWLFLAVVFSGVALYRSAGLRELRRRLERLEEELRVLQSAFVARGGGQETEPPPTERAPARIPQEERLPQAAAPPEPTPQAPSPRVEAPREMPPRAPSPPPPPPPPPGPAIHIDWERWVGVQGAAVLGGVALALAGLLFFKYSIEHELISPTLRVILGTVVGLSSIVAAQQRRAKDYPDVANAVTGAGLVILYASFWAARNLYALIDVGTAFVLMSLVTSTGCLLSVRRSSLVIALLGLVGGFATPFLISARSDNPIGLFGYVLLLDLALLTIARRRRWPLLASLSLLGTVLYQGFWILTRMQADRLLIGLVVLGLFGLLFALAGHRAPREERKQWLVAQAGGVLVPFVFAVYIAGNARLDVHFYPLALLLLLLSAGACWLDRAQPQPFLALGTASGDVAVSAVWLLTRPLTPGLVWESVACCFLLALTFHVFVEWTPEPAGLEGPAPAAITTGGGFLLFEVAGSVQSGVSPWPWLAGWLGLAGLLVRHGTFPRRERLQWATATALAASISLAHLVHGEESSFGDFTIYLAASIAVALAFQSVALARKPGDARVHAEHAAAALPLILLLALVTVPGRLRIDPLLLVWTALGLGFLVALAATRVRSGIWYLLAVLATAFVHSSSTWWDPALRSGPSLSAFAPQLAAVGLFTAWPFLVAAVFRAERPAWYAAALAGPAWFLPLKQLFVLRFGDAAIGVLPVCLAAVSLVALARVRTLWPDADPMRKTALAWFAAVGLGFVSVTMPLQLEKEWVTIGWALEGVAVTLLWKRLDHTGLKYFGLALLAVVTARLVANEAVLGYYPRSGWRIVNWLLYTYWIPAAALLGTSVLLRDVEVARARAWERETVYPAGQPVGAIACGLAAIVVIFVWINLAIADWFSTGPMLTLTFERMPARDLSTSIAWAAYALVLLAIGMARQTSGLRWVSLGFLVLTIGKVFLYDLGQLKDLYRVMSLVGLAASLILVSLGYQRFVFRKSVSEER